VSNQFPAYLVEVCQAHHDEEPDAGEFTELVHAVRIVSGINVLRVGSYPRTTLDQEIRQSLAALRVNDETVRELGKFLQKVVTRVDGRLSPK